MTKFTVLEQDGKNWMVSPHVAQLNIRRTLNRVRIINTSIRTIRLQFPNHYNTIIRKGKYWTIFEKRNKHLVETHLLYLNGNITFLTNTNTKTKKWLHKQCFKGTGATNSKYKKRNYQKFWLTKVASKIPHPKYQAIVHWLVSLLADTPSDIIIS